MSHDFEPEPHEKAMIDVILKRNTTPEWIYEFNKFLIDERTTMEIIKFIDELLHQELQKARESERARIEDEFAKVAKYTQDFESDAYGENPVNTSYYQLYEGQWEYIIKPKDQSELDQPSNK